MLKDGKDYVFTGPDLGFVSINHLRERIWSSTLVEAKLRRRNMYQTRHSFASNALSAGEDPSWVSRTMGHKNTEILFRVYARFLPNRTRRDGNALAAHMATPEPSGGESQDTAAKQG